MDNDLFDAPSLRWGILAPGGIAHSFAQAVLADTGQQIVAVGSRSLLRAKQFAQQYSIPRAYGSYEELVVDDGVDAVYVASPHSHHREHALLAIRAGKHVLVEKAFARNAAEARDIVEAAAKERVFCMEAMWTRFLPHMIELRRMVGAGELGEIVAVEADHGQYFDFDPVSRLFDPRLAGGALLDLGIYPVSFACDVLGQPNAATAIGHLTETNVDGQVSVLLDYDGKALATATTTLWAASSCVAQVVGTEARVEIPGAFYVPNVLHVIRRGAEPEVRCAPAPERGHHYQAVEVARRVGEGELYSPLMSPTESVQIMELLDDIRAQVGVVYPGE